MNQKNQKGITLIALVITIIVLLILAGVTINMVLGDEGIIQNAQLAKAMTRDTQLSEEVELWEAEKEVAERTGGIARTQEKFFEDLFKKGLIDSPEVKTLIDRNGNVIYEEKIEIITFTISDLRNINGQHDYQAEKGMTWVEWINSDKYNTISLDPMFAEYEDTPDLRSQFQEKAIASYSDYGKFISYCDDNGNDLRLLTHNNKLVTSSSVISNGYVYSGIDSYSIEDENIPQYTFTVNGVEYASDTNVDTWQTWFDSDVYNTLTDENMPYDSMYYLLIDDTYYITLDGEYVDLLYSKPIYGANYVLTEEEPPYYFTINGDKYRLPSPNGAYAGSWSSYWYSEYDTTNGRLQISDDWESVTYDGKTLYLDGVKVGVYDSFKIGGNYTAE